MSRFRCTVFKEQHVFVTLVPHTVQLSRRVETEASTLLARLNAAAVVHSFARRVLAFAVFQSTRIPANADFVRAYTRAHCVRLVFALSHAVKTGALCGQRQQVTLSIMRFYRTDNPA